MNHEPGRRHRKRSSVPAAPKFKVILLGEVGVGKSALFMRLKDNIFGVNIQPTVGIDSCSKSVDCDGEKVIFQVWDTAGVEKYRTLTRNYYRNTHAILLVYSVDNPASLQYLSKWVEDAVESSPSALRFLLGNKSDLERVIRSENIHDFAMAHEMDSAYIVSAKTGDGVEGALSKIGEKLLDSFNTPLFNESIFDESVSLHVNNTAQHKSSCC